MFQKFWLISFIEKLQFRALSKFRLNKKLWNVNKRNFRQARSSITGRFLRDKLFQNSVTIIESRVMLSGAETELSNLCVITDLNDGTNTYLSEDIYSPLAITESGFEEFQISNRWTTTATNGGGLVQGDPTTLTWSIVADGVSIPGFNGEPTSNSSLIAFMDGLYGAGPGGANLTLRPWFSIFANSLARLGEISGLNYVYEPNDDGAAFGSASAGVLGIRGDVRISGHFIDGQSGSNVLAYNFFPNTGDMVIDTGNPIFFADTSNNSVSLRNVLMHELGHGIGLSHVESSDSLFLMEPFVNTTFDGPQIDDILAIQRNYGDPLEENGGNNTSATAFNLGTIAIGSSVSKGTLGDNKVVQATQNDFISIDDETDIDFYKFTLSANSRVAITLTPRGTSYLQGPQGGAQSFFNSKTQQDLVLQILGSDGTTVIQTIDATAAGVNEVFNATLNAGQYFVKITGKTSNTIQMYGLQVTANNPDLPDLVGSFFDVVVEPQVPGALFDVKYTVANQGTIAAANTRVDFYLSLNNTITATDVFLGSFDIGTLAAGANTGLLTQSLTLPAPSHAIFSGGTGTYTIGMIVDAGSAVTELDDTNNSNLGQKIDLESITINVPPLIPEIELLDGATNILDNTGMVDFGFTTVGTNLNKTFTIRNTGIGNLTISNISVPTGFSVIFPPPSNIAAGGSGTFTVRLSGATAGNYSGQISFNTNDTDENPFNFAIKGAVEEQPEIEIQIEGTNINNAGSFNFGTTTLNNPISKVLTITNSGNGPLRISNYTISNGNYSFTTPLTAVVAAQSSTQITIQMDASTVGGKIAIVTINNNDNNEGTFNFILSGNVIVSPEIEVKDGTTDLTDAVSVVQMGTTNVGTPITKTFTINNTGSSNLFISSINIPAGYSFVGINPTSVGVGSSASFTIQLNAAVVGVYNGTITINNNDTNENPFTFTIEGTVNPVISPEIDITESGKTILDDGTYSFGNLPFNVPHTKTFQITNKGNTVLNLGALTVSPGFTFIGSLPSTLAVGGSITFDIAVNTSAAGLLTGTFSLVTDDFDENPYNFTLEANVEQPPEITVYDRIGVIPDNTGIFDFGSTEINTSLSQQFIILNTGVGILHINSIVVPPGFSITSPIPKDIASQQSAVITVRLDAVTHGTFQGDLVIQSNDIDETTYNFKIGGVVTGTPEISVLDLNTNIPDNSGIVNFGTTTEGTIISKTFTITNSGNIPLQLGAVVVSTGFRVKKQPPPTIAANGTAEFIIEMLAETAGIKNGTLIFNTNDQDENPFNFLLTGTVLGSEIVVLNDNTNINDNTGVISFGGTFQGTAVTKNFTIWNTGNATLTLGTVTVPDGFELVTAPPATLAASASAIFQVKLKADKIGAYNGRLSFSTNDRDESPFDFSINGMVYGAEIEVLQDGNNIADNTGVVSYGARMLGSPLTKTFTIKNTGNIQLNISSTSLRIPAGFTLVGSFPTLVNAGATASFQLKFDASKLGPFNGQVSFINTDLDEREYNFSVNGYVYSPEIEVLQDGVNIPDNIGIISFGGRNIGSPLTKTFTIKNTGNMDLNLGTVTLPEGFKLVTPPPAVVAAGQVATFQVSFDPKRIGAHNGQLSFNTNDPDENPFNFSINGFASGAEIEVWNENTNITDNTGAITFGGRNVGSPLTKTFTIKNTGNIDLKLGNVSVPEGFTLVTAPQATIAAGGSATFSVKFNASAPGGYSGQITFSTNDADENPFNFFVNGTAYGSEIEVWNENTNITDNSGIISFGGRLVGSPLTKTFTIKNTGNIDLKLGNVSVPAGFTLVSAPPATIAAGGSATFAVRFDANSGGGYSGQISFSTNDADENPFNFFINGTAYGPEITVSQNGTNLQSNIGTVDFGTTTIGNPVIRTFTISNTGNLELTIGNVVVPAGYSLLSQLPAVIAAGASVTFQLRLNATAPGLFNGQFIIKNNDNDEKEFIINLTGRVVFNIGF